MSPHPRLALALASVLGLALVAWFWWRGERFIAANGPTFDEGVHLVAGYGYWTAGEFGLNREDPPLLKLLWAAPLLFTDTPPFPHAVAEATRGNHWAVADAWLYESGVSPRSLLDPARRVNLALGCGLVLLVGGVAYRVWRSAWAGLAGVAFAATDPTLLALSCVLSTDIGVSLFGFLACYLLWEYAGNPTRGLLVGCGAALGLALGAKFSAVGLVAGLVLAGAVFVRRGGRLTLPERKGGGPGPGGPQPGGPRPGGLLPLAEFALRLGLIALVTTAATYAFLHFPEWGRGLKFQLTRGSHGDGIAYLNGEVSRTGWYHYFLVAVPLKIPLGLLLAVSVGAVSLFGRVGIVSPVGREGGMSRVICVAAVSRVFCVGAVSPASRASPSGCGVWLVVPPLVFLVLASYSRVNLGVRLVLPCFPFLYLLAAGLLRPGARSAVRAVLAVVCLTLCVAAAGRASPHELTSFSELVGPPANGAKYLADSNLDWGQGLPALKRWMDANGLDVVYLGYFGTDRPEAHGIRYRPLPGYGRVGPPGGEAIPAEAPRHVVAVSVNHLLGLYLNEPRTYAWLRDRAPLASPGGCIRVYDLTADPAALARLRSLPKQ